MKTKYLIDTPPPTISGTLHIGHIFSYTQGDIAARYNKYLNKELIYPFCFDNNGIPTGKLASKNGIKGIKNIIDFSIDKSLEYKENFTEAGIEFADQEYHTYDDNSISIAYKAFEILKEKGIAYKATTDYLWSEKLQTSISQSEIDDNGIIERTGEKAIIKTGEGWFINIKDHLPQLREQINKIDWKPIHFKNRALDWIDAIEWDWSISRERNFGIKIPEEESTFDTWFISSLSPYLAWASHTKDDSIKDCPIFDMRFQSHDIIRTWAFYTITMSYFLSNQIPWKTIMISGHTLDGKGNKFSKSSGNATIAKPFIDKYGARGIRHWSISSTLGTDTKIDETRMRQGWKIYNKFQNAKNFIEMQKTNGWIGKDDNLIKIWTDYKSKILLSFDNYDYYSASEIMYEFFWNTFCDKWIEQSKKEPISETLEFILEDFYPIFNIIYGN
jgi:valyl-tRNA synthetase